MVLLRYLSEYIIDNLPVVEVYICNRMFLEVSNLLVVLSVRYSGIGQK